MTLDQETPRETRDWTKLLWVGIVAMLALMALILWWAGRPEPGTSIVYSKHILIGYDPGNPADRERAFELAARLRERVLAGEDFARLAREYSSDKNSATRGGELPPFRRMDELEPAFAQYVWNGPV
ncbi:MAG TPA: peptidylprolyl isomerase, partial [Candidatus Hydrogenedentes bacterium]|nr:peptidylprolyl isomerase [Candidatus Hydrogenedentota bacterium]